MPSEATSFDRDTISLRSKLPGVGDSIFSVMSRKARQAGAINLSQGFPSFDTPPDLIERVHHYMREGYNQYSPMPGVPELRQALAGKMHRLYGAQIDPEEEITVTAGATQGVYTALSAVVDYKDEVVIVEPAYDAYPQAIKMSKGRPIYIEATPPEYRFPIEELKKVVSYHTRAILLNNPHNPTGSVLTEEDLRELAKITRGTDIILICDEVYEHLYFDGRKHHSLCCHPELSHRSFSVFSFGKTYHTTGWKMGYTIGPPELTKEFRKVHQFMLFCVMTPVQYAMAEFIANDAYYDELRRFYHAKRDFLRNALESSRFQPLPCEAGFFLNLDYSGITRRSDVNFATELIEQHGVASVPNSAFYHDGNDYKILRFCFAKHDETLQQAADILCKI
jgi:methionine aminotransferase